MKGPKPTPVVERILRKVRITDDGCWEYLGRRLPMGYGQITANPNDGYPRTVLTHRVMFEAYKHNLGDLHVDHLCCNTWCCNPDHLQAVPQSDNNALTRARGNHANMYGPTRINRQHG